MTMADSMTHMTTVSQVPPHFICVLLFPWHPCLLCLPGILKCCAHKLCSECQSLIVALMGPFHFHISSHSPSALSHAIGNIVKKAFFCTLSELSESHNLLGIGFLGHNYHNLYLQSCIILSVGFSVLMTPWMLFSKASTEVFSLGKSFSIF